MKKYIFILWLCTLSAFYSFAQSDCGLNTTTPTVNIWDWRQEFWEIYPISNITIPNPIRSPFYQIEGNQNAFGLAAFEDKDNKVEDGWELLKVNLGTLNVPTSQPYVILYNKYTSRIRVFFLVVQLYSAFSNATNNGNDARVSISFVTGSNSSSFPYQSNLFTTIESPLKPLDQFERNIMISTPNYFQNILPYWLYADFTVAYDPCTCRINEKSIVVISSTLLNSEKIEFMLNAQPYKKTVESGQVGSDFLTAVKEFGSRAEKGQKSAETAIKVINEIGAGVLYQQAITEQQKATLDKDLKELKQFLELGLGWVSLVPKVGVAANSIIGLMDFFIGGGKKSEGSPNAAIILNNFKADGTISSASNANQARFALPGSNQVGLTPDLKPVYNNVLGVFNLLTTPIIETKRFPIAEPRYNQTIVSNANCSIPAPTPSNCNYEITYAAVDELRYYKIPNTFNLHYVVNNALGIDLASSDVKAALVFENGSKIVGSNLISEVEANGKPVYRTNYYPIGKLKDVTAQIRFLRGYSLIQNFGDCQCPDVIPFIPSNISVKVFVKVVAKLKKGNTPKEDIIFIAKYPVKLNNPITIQNPLNVTNPQLIYTYSGIWDITTGGTFILPTLALAIFDNTVIRTTDRNIIIQAPQIELVASSGGQTSVVVLQEQGSIVFEAKNTSYQPPASTNQINLFCNNVNLYKKPERITANRENEENTMNSVDKDNNDWLTAYPNPAKSNLVISYFLEQDEEVLLYISNIMGERIAILHNGFQEKGKQEISFLSQNLPAGVYLYTLEASQHKITKRLVIVK